MPANGSTLNSRANPKPVLLWSDEQRLRILLAAYSKHASELSELERANTALIATLLGIYSAGIGLLSKLESLNYVQRIGLIAAAVAFLVLGITYTRLRDHARSSIRGALVRIETALSVYETNIFLSEDSLYPDGFRSYPNRSFLGSLIYLLGLVALAFIAVVITAN
jgi:hypothetical protein